MKRITLLCSLLAVAILIAIFKPHIRKLISPLFEKTVANQLQEYGAPARQRMQPFFEKAHLTYPPARVTLVGLKAERVLQVYGANSTNGGYQFIRAYPILAASGVPGPKLREGDGQVPEGIYPIALLNPNSQFHLSLRIGYPNPFDREQARKEARLHLGGDIMIHGGSASVGCLAVGDEAAEDLFILAADSGLQNISVILSPVDFRTGATVPKAIPLPEWTKLLYAQIKSNLSVLPLVNK